MLPFVRDTANDRRIVNRPIDPTWTLKKARWSRRRGAPVEACSRQRLLTVPMFGIRRKKMGAISNLSWQGDCKLSLNQTFRFRTNKRCTAFAVRL
jgi:hypothetical protein